MTSALAQAEPEVLARVRRVLAQRNVDSYLVGGYIRDALLGRPTRDIDIAVAAPALEVAMEVATSLHARYVPLDEVNKVARVVFLDRQRGTEARWYLDFSTVEAGIEEDLHRRDFTINAMSVNLKDLENGSGAHLIDPLQGKRDLAQGLIRAASESAFQDDPGRLLRAVRLAAEYGFAIDSHTEDLIKSSARLVSTVAAERVREELCRLLACQQAARYLYYLDGLGLLTAIIPELEGTRGVEQPREHYWDVFVHSIETVAALERILDALRSGSRDAVLVHLPSIPGAEEYFSEEVAFGVSRAVIAKLGSLLHDIAKPQTKSLEPGGRARFLGHTKIGGKMAADIMQRLRFSNREAKMVQVMVESHLRLWQMGGDGTPTKRAIYRFFRDTRDASIEIIYLTLADFLAAQGPNLDTEEWAAHCRMMDHVWSEHATEEAEAGPVKLINGHDLMGLFGLEPGPRLGELLASVHEAQAVGEVASREDALAFVRRHLVADSGK